MSQLGKVKLLLRFQTWIENAKPCSVGDVEGLRDSVEIE